MSRLNQKNVKEWDFCGDLNKKPCERMALPINFAEFQSADRPSIAADDSGTLDDIRDIDKSGISYRSQLNKKVSFRIRPPLINSFQGVNVFGNILRAKFQIISS